MYNPYLKKFQPDSKGALICLDTETLSMEQNAILSEIAFLQVAPFGAETSLEIHLSPDAYHDKIGNFDLNEETVAFHDKNHKGDYIWLLNQRSHPSSQIAADQIIAYLAQFTDSQIPVVIFCRGTDFDPPRLKHFLAVHGYDLNQYVHYRNFRDIRSQEAIFYVGEVRGDHTAMGDCVALKKQMLMMAHKHLTYADYLNGEMP